MSLRKKQANPPKGTVRVRVKEDGSDTEWVSLRTPSLDPLGYVLVRWLAALPQVFTEAQCPAVRP